MYCEPCWRGNIYAQSATKCMPSSSYILHSENCTDDRSAPSTWDDENLDKAFDASCILFGHGRLTHEALVLFLEVIGLDVVPDIFLFAFLLLHFSEEHSTGWWIAGKHSRRLTRWPHLHELIAVYLFSRTGARYESSALIGYSLLQEIWYDVVLSFTPENPS